jgi:outer membrane protein assembly factor BamB
MWWVSSFAAAQLATPEQQAEEILKACEIKGGLIIHIGCGDGRLSAALRAGEGYLVHGLDTSQNNIERARQYLQSLGVYGAVSVDKLEGDSLPYIDNLVNLVVAEELGTVPMSEVMRILCPDGVAYIRNNGQWAKTVKPRPKAIDEWTHYLYDASNNAVSHDDVVAPPRRMQWVGSPRYARHHDRMSSVSAAVSAGGRVFYIMDEASHVSILIPAKWALIARDAFNGTILWKRPIDKWFTHLWPLKSGPAQLPRRLVTDGDHVYATLSLDAPLTALDAATGETLRTYEGTGAAEEIILSDGVLFVLANDAVQKPDYDGSRRFARGAGAKFWDEAPRKLVAVRADDGALLWAARQRILPGTLAADEQRVVFHDGLSVVCLDRKTGEDIWRSKPIARADEIRSFYVPILVLYEDPSAGSGQAVVLFSGGETAGLQTGSWYTSGKDTMTALSATTGEVLWTAYHPPSGYRSPEDLLVANGLVWTGETTSGRAVGVFTGRDPRTGDVKSEFSPDVEVYWFHHRCYRGKATDNYLLMSRAGTEFLDVRNKQWIPNHWTRGACLYGVMPANGLLYNPPHPCACYLESKLYGFNALAPAPTGPRIASRAEIDARLEKGPAYGQIENRNSKIENSNDWPTYRHDAARSGRASTTVPSALERAWHAGIGGRLTSPVVAGGKVFVGSVDSHTLHVLDAASGEKLWCYTAGGRIDSPPTFHRGRVLFGSADGWVYCLDASDGALLWRFLAAPMDQRLTAFEQLESVWPVHGSVLVRDDVLYCVAGRSMFLDGGLHVLRLDAKTGRLLSQTVLNERDPATGTDLHTYVSWLNMPPALPDVLSSDGRHIYMRSQPFTLEQVRFLCSMIQRFMGSAASRNTTAGPRPSSISYSPRSSPTPPTHRARGTMASSRGRFPRKANPGGP